MRARHQEGGSKGTLDRLGRLLALPEWPREEDQTSKTKNHVLTPIELLADASRSFCMCCAVGIEPNVERIKEHTENPLMLVTAFNPHVGHQKAAKISLTACRQHLSARAASLKFGFLTDEQFDLWVRVEEVTHPLPSR